MTTEQMTNEPLKGICQSNFQLAHYAINVGRYFIASGREFSLSTILKEVRKHPDPSYIEKLREIDEITEEDEEPREY